VAAASAAVASAAEAVERFEGSVIFLFVILSEERSDESKDPYRRSNLSLKRGSCWLLVPPVAQVLPLRVALLDQRNLSLPLPTLQLFFASNGCRNLPIGLVIEQAVNPIGSGSIKLSHYHPILGGESAKRVLFVLTHSKGQIAGDADVQRAAEAAENVNRIATLALVTHGF
jgi:hypothetical protein